ncbi:B-cell receptor-associated protein 31-like [Rhopilema esculentum]|uniref:B-cell receptor-associated protein 31-like n=1 Tax=Rhopilema esculentum TaxID=499914 RepID=UPI0031E015C0
MVSLQWVSAAAFLYSELFAGFLLCLPFISNARWRKIFNSRLISIIKTNGNYFFVVSVLIMIFLFFDSVLQVRKYSKVEAAHQVDLKNNPHAEVQAHMKLFRAQRNCYITGFALFMLPFLRRLVTLISSLAAVEASHEAVTKQAHGATDQCKKLLDEVEELKKGGALVGKTEEKKGSEETDVKKQLDKKKQELKEKETELEKMSKDLQSMKSQAEGLTKEYDRILEENEKLQKRLIILGNEEEGSKKDN